MDHTQIKQIVALFPCFSSLSSYDWQSAAIVRVDPSTRHPVMEGHFLEHAIFVIKGSIRIYKTNPLGREVTLYHIRDGQCCPLMLCSILGETEYEASAEIESNAEIFVVPVSLFHQWLDHHRPLKQFIFKQITEKVIDVTRLLDDIAFKSIQHRLAEYLLRTTAQGSSKFVITHEQLSVELGTAREVISRTLKDFEKQGLLQLGRGHITLSNRTLLEQLITNVTKSR